MSDRTKRGRHREKGSVLLEFGLVVTLLLVLMFGIIDFARALYAYHFIASAAREGTRYAIVRGAACDPNLAGCYATNDTINAYLKGSATGIGLDPNLLSVIATFSPPNYDSSGQQVTNCAVSSTTGLYDTPGCAVQVQVEYAFRFVFPFMPTQTCTVGTGSQATTANICMSSTSEMVISQ